MRIHKAGRKRRIAQIDRPGTIRDRQIAASIDNLIALHDHDAVLHEGSRFAIEYPHRFQHNRLIGRRAGLDSKGCNDENGTLDE